LATAELGALSEGLSDMRRSAESLRQQDLLNFDGLLKIALADAETRAGDRDRAIAILDEALATANRLGYRAFEAELHRARGEILLQCDPTNPAPAEDAFLTAIAVAKQQGTRSFEVRAALSLAKLYQSTSRPLDAHVVLAPALEGFTPTPEMPEIAEAQAMLAALSSADEVKVEAARRQRMTQLQAAYGAALIAARGFGAPETTEAFARARESAASDDSLQRLAADYGLWAGNYVRGDLPAMKAQAAAFLADVAAKPDSGEAGIAHRVQGMTHLFAGEFVEGARELELALARFEPGRDDDLAVRFPPDPGAAAMIYLAFASWALSEFGQAASLIERMRARVEGLSHATTLAHATALTAFFALMRGDRSQAGTSVSELARIVRDHELPLFRAIGEFLVGWADAEGGSLAEGLAAMRRGVESLRAQNAVVFDGIIKIALAEAEARAGDPERALTVLDEALATCERTGYRAFECELHRARGDILPKCDPTNPAPAEDAFKTAIALAKRQGARGYQLLASLALAKLYRTTSRLFEAHALLAPELEGLSPTPEMPEIAEAQALLRALNGSSIAAGLLSGA
jgi:predicted ATPase